MKGKFRVHEDRHGQSNWRVEGKINGKRIRAFFHTKEQADEHARIKNIEMENFGHQTAEIGANLRVEAVRCDEQLRAIGATLTKATEYYLAHHDTRSNSLSVAEACSRCRLNLTVRHERDEISRPHLRTMYTAIGKLEDLFGEEQICDLTPKMLRDALIRMPVSAASKNNYRTNWSGLFSFAKDHGWVKENPTSEVITPTTKRSFQSPRGKLPGIFSVQEAARLLESAARPELVPVIAIGLFAGLRPAEIGRLHWDEILWGKKLIDVKSKKSKTAQPRWVDMSDNLVEWLAPYRQASGPINPFGQSLTCNLIVRTRKAAGIAKWPQDGLRHSFGSYHLAMHEKDGGAPLTAKEMGHMTSDMVYAHYNNRVMKEQAQAYFSIRPAGAEKVVAMAV